MCGLRALDEATEHAAPTRIHVLARGIARDAAMIAAARTMGIYAPMSGATAVMYANERTTLAGAMMAYSAMAWTPVPTAHASSTLTTHVP
jgi:hypothetical protein